MFAKGPAQTNPVDPVDPVRRIRPVKPGVTPVDPKKKQKEDGSGDFKRMYHEELKRRGKLACIDSFEVLAGLAWLEKVEFPVGTVHTWGGRKFKKVAPGDWRPESGGPSRIGDSIPRAFGHKERAQVKKIVDKERDWYNKDVQAMGTPRAKMKHLNRMVGMAKVIRNHLYAAQLAYAFEKDGNKEYARIFHARAIELRAARRKGTELEDVKRLKAGKKKPEARLGVQVAPQRKDSVKVPDQPHFKPLSEGGFDAPWSEKRQELEEALMKKKFTERKLQRGQNINAVFFNTLEDGHKVVFKPAELEMPLAGGVRRSIRKDVPQAVREAAAYTVDRALGLGLVPPTVLKTDEELTGIEEQLPDWQKKDFKGIKKLSGSLQHRIDNPEQGFSVYIDSYRKSPKLRFDLEKLAVLDFVLGNTDRHGANYLVAEHKGDKRLVAIDHGLCFPEAGKSGEFRSHPFLNWRPEFGPKLTPDLVEQLKKVKYEEITEPLKAFGLGPEAEGVWHRLRMVAEKGELRNSMIRDAGLY